MTVELEPIGVVKTRAASVPRHCRVSNVEGQLVIDPQYQEGLRDIHPGQHLVVLFHFNQSPPFTPDHLVQKPPHRSQKLGIFSTCSPIRPNPLGLSILEVVAVKDNVIRVKGIDMLDGTPILDLKPFVPPPPEDLNSSTEKPRGSPP
jgi:tRNA-Thr(GGU) m(6)t(6)A37 methyltransferase TsaA|uniref:tRNA (N6-threonylcarbamoyladenosine(37)-N6)-methyltransferase TrmO n=1 Tax=Desulfobacca acetoxidans TaxID=60893 RepID=A0A7C3UYW9_9BACT